MIYAGLIDVSPQMHLVWRFSMGKAAIKGPIVDFQCEHASPQNMVSEFLSQKRLRRSWSAHHHAMWISVHIFLA